MGMECDFLSFFVDSIFEDGLVRTDKGEGRIQILDGAR